MNGEYYAIGETAGKIYRVLEKGGTGTFISLQKETGVSDHALFHQALGWLAREEKVTWQKKGKTFEVSLVGADRC